MLEESLCDRLASHQGEIYVTIEGFKTDVYANGKRQEFNFCRLPFMLLCNNVKIFAFVVNGRYISIFLLVLFKD